MLVLIKDNNLPPSHWQRGRVIDIHLGNDGVIRVATVQTIAVQVKRAVRLLCPLHTVENACEVRYLQYKKYDFFLCMQITSIAELFYLYNMSNV